MTTTKKYICFKIREDETFYFGGNNRLFLTLIEADSNKYFLEISSPIALIGRRLQIDGKIARHIYDVFKQQLLSSKYLSEIMLCLDNAFSYKTLRETVFAAKVYNKQFTNHEVLKIRSDFDLDYQYQFDNALQEDKALEPVSVIVNFSGKSKPMGYFRGAYLGTDYRFHFYPNS